MAASQKTSRAAGAAPTIGWYVVLHGAVGGWEQGRVVTAEELQNIDIDRLLRLGAIAPTQEPIKDVLPIAAEDAPPAESE
jgi:hypothetical protein